MAMPDYEMMPYLKGEKLYGDDLGAEEVLQWFEDEREAYASLGSSHTEGHKYPYEALNCTHGFRHLPQGSFHRLLSLGGASGSELYPVLNRVDEITIVEPSATFRSEYLSNVPVSYVEPSPLGILPFEDGAFHLVTCFGTLHHIANVSTVLRECFRCLAPNGYMLLREPVVSMGDWRLARRGLTKRERGIPIRILRNMVQSTGFLVIKENRCMCSITPRLGRLLRRPAYNSLSLVQIDRLLSHLLSWNSTYHASSAWQKLRPTSVFLVLVKPW